ncbi:MAG TPA: hypothetical protein VKB78_14870, partial [Pirellulales bacterium]|nr:hypothetical protein [Pirellulales bacterium]
PNVMVLDSNRDSPNKQSSSSTVVESTSHRADYAVTARTSLADLSLQRSAVGLVTLLAIAFIGALIAAANAKNRQPMFASVTEIESRLGIPVLGRLAWAGTGIPAIARAIAEPTWVRRTVLVGEIALGLAIAAIALVAIADFETVRQLATDPLTGIVQAIAKLHG